MTEEAPFVAAISAEGATARLVFADWLDEDRRHVDAAIQRVLARPDEDGLRLAFADACNEEADFLFGRFLVLPESKRGRYIEMLRSRAELTRVQVRLAQMEADLPENHAAPWGDLCRREREILVESAKAKLFGMPEGLTYWLIGEPQNPPATFPVNLVGAFRRGFIERVTGPAALWLEHCDGILAAHPVSRFRPTTPLEFQFVDVRTEHTAIHCTYTVRVSAHGFMTGQILPDRCFLSSPSTDVLVCDHLAGLLPRADFERALFDRFWPGIEYVPLGP